MGASFPKPLNPENMLLTGTEGDRGASPETLAPPPTLARWLRNEGGCNRHGEGLRLAMSKRCRQLNNWHSNKHIRRTDDSPPHGAAR